MKKKPGRKPEVLDINQLAARITELATGEPVGPQAEPDRPAKDPAAVALGARWIKGRPSQGEEARQEEAQRGREEGGGGSVEQNRQLT